MPIRKPPHSLYDISLNVFVHSFIRLWIKSKKLNMKDSYHLLSLEKYNLPPLIIDNIVPKMIMMYITILNNYGKHKVRNICLFLESVIVSHMSVLDLSNLMSLGVMHNEYFEQTIALKLPFLKNLIKISLRTHGIDVTLPICTDFILKEIGQNCHKLKSIDLSNNGLVNDSGLLHLIPTSENLGCPFLEEIYLYECNVSVEGIAYVLHVLPNIRIIGFNELAFAVRSLYSQLPPESELLKDGLNLTHVNHSGSIVNRKGCNSRKLQFSKKTAKVVRVFCPKLTTLKVRVADSDLTDFQYFPSLTSLELIYYVTRPSSPGIESEQFLKLYGLQFSSIAIICNVLHENQINLIGETCLSLKYLWLKCNAVILYPPEISRSVPKCMLSSLETLYFRIGENENHVTEFPLKVLKVLLCSTNSLKELKLFVRSPSISDEWLSDLIASINTSFLETLVIALPYRNVIPGAISLSSTSYHMLLDHVPLLQELGNLYVWKLSSNEVDQLRSDVNFHNYNLNIICNTMTMK